MAHLEVEPKKSNPWLWIILVLVALAILFFLFKGCGGQKTETMVTDTTSTNKTTSDTSSKQVVAATQPDWNDVDFNSPETPDPAITDKDVTVRGNDKYTIYTLGQDILFAPGKSTLQETAVGKLKQITAALNSRFKGATIGVYGSADATGDAETNKQIGQDRANVVKNWLTKNGIDNDKVSVQSLGESQPVASNDTKGGRAQNRNVAIVAFPAK